jgi:predicted ribosome quality control (RQC) complex YloA/Tae2 family protein
MYKKTIIVISMLMILVGCSKLPEPTFHQKKVKAYEECMNHNKSSEICKGEIKSISSHHMKIVEALAIKHCPSEVKEWELAKEKENTENIKFKFSPLRDIVQNDLTRREAKIDRMKKELAKLECILKKEPRVNAGPLVNKYFHSGEAERDTGLNK